MRKRLYKRSSCDWPNAPKAKVYAHEFSTATQDNTAVSTPELTAPSSYDQALHTNNANAVMLQSLGAAGLGWYGGPYVAAGAGLISFVQGVQSQCLSCHW